MSWSRRCDDVEATRAAGEHLAGVLRGGDLVILEGPLGAGKTALTQGIARGLGVSDRVTSPTFTVVRQHETDGRAGIATLHHVDIYRVENLGEVVDLALGELLEESAVAVVEWGELAASVFGDEVLHVRIEVASDESRTLTVTGALARARARELDQWSHA